MKEKNPQLVLSGDKPIVWHHTGEATSKEVVEKLHHKDLMFLEELVYPACHQVYSKVGCGGGFIIIGSVSNKDLKMPYNDVDIQLTLDTPSQYSQKVSQALVSHLKSFLE